MPASTLIIINPRAGAAPARFGVLEARLRDALGDLEVARTRGPRDATRIAREAARAGVRRLVAGGGDGTLSEIVTGVLAAGLGEEVEIGLLPLGSGCDFARSVGAPRSLQHAVEQLAAGETRRVDAGRIQCVDSRGRERTLCFLNEASFGLSAFTVDWMNRVGRRLGPRLGFAVGAGLAVLRHPTPEVLISVDDKEVYAGPVCMVVVANGGSFGGGMRIAPAASPDDGLFEVVVVSALSRTRLLANFPALYRGTHVGHPAVEIHRGSRVAAQLVEGTAAHTEADGELLGCLPASMELLPGAIRLFGLAESREGKSS